MEKAISEKEYIIRCYKMYFAHFQDKKMVIYGIGKNTRIILENFTNENIVGLMDESRTGEWIYGKEIITMEEAVSRGTEIILIVARASNVNIIYRRISEVCAYHGIRIYDINGEEITPEAVMDCDCSAYLQITFSNLKQKIDSVEVISFDIFDTLVMRDVLYPRDIFSLVEMKTGHGFRDKRIRSEVNLYAEGKSPRLKEIYARMGEDFLPEYELEEERKHLHRRQSGCQALDYAQKQGKEIYFVSDMYLDSIVLERLLQDLDIPAQKERILVSCEFGVSKCNGLFLELRKRAGTRRILHVGDNREADIEAARRYGIEDTFYIPNALKMLEDSYAESLLNYTVTLEARLVIGKFLTQVFSDGFIFSDSQGKIVLSNNRQIGEIFVAPFIYRFFGWLLDMAEKKNLEHILLAARDGRLLERIYYYFEEKGRKQPRMDYFYISRAVAVLAGIREDEDILHSSRLAFNGSEKELLKSRFRLADEDICPQRGMVEQDYILMHKEAILKSADKVRGRFEKYIASICNEDEEDIGFFDFISSGTCQKALMNIVNFHLTGLYVGNVNNETEYKPDIDVSSMFGESSYNVFKKGYCVLDNYFLLENIITSEEATLIDFDQEGHPVLGQELRTDRQLQALEDIQNGVLSYIKESSLEPEDMCRVDLKLVDLIFGLLSESSCVVRTDYFREHHLEDSFCNRKFDLDLPR